MAVEEHYTRRDLIGAIREALRDAGKDPVDLQPADLATVDEFHIRGRQATIELADRIKPMPANRVLDIGSGLGRASRTLAAAFGCHVTGIDLMMPCGAVAKRNTSSADFLLGCSRAPKSPSA